VLVIRVLLQARRRAANRPEPRTAVSGSDGLPEAKEADKLVLRDMSML
jgi:hypothetical protein